jgi:hypothetical protein
MKRLTTNRPDNSASDQNNSRKESQNKGRLTGRAKNRLGTRLPFVLVLTVLSAIIAAGLTFSNWRPGFEASRAVDRHRQAGVKVSEPKPAVPRAKVFADETGLTSLANSVGVEKKVYSPRNIVRHDSPTTTDPSRATKIPQVVEMTGADGTEQSSETSPQLRSERISRTFAIASSSEREGDRERLQEQDGGRPQPGEAVATGQTPDRTIDRHPKEDRLLKARRDFKGDLRNLPRTRPPQRERNEPEPPPLNPSFYVPPGGVVPQTPAVEPGPVITPQANAPAPAPLNVFEGLDRFNWGAGSPPDTNGDVGKDYYIQTVNTSIGIFRKSDGFMEAAFTFNTFMSQGNFGNLCDTNNFGDPVVLYDTFEDRWIITDFAFLVDGSGNSIGPAYQCIAASKGGNPITDGWNFYSIKSSDFLNDYPKFGIWPDGLYMSANMFTFGPSVFQTARAWAFNKAQMYAGSPTVKVLIFNVPGGDFTAVPSNARLQTGTPPPGRPNLYVSTQLFLNALAVYKFHVDWNNLGSSTFSGPDTPLSPTSWPNANVANVPQSGTSQLLDALQIRSMVQNQYTNYGGVESLWVPHTVRRANTSGFAAPRWYQADVTGGTVAANLVQATTWDPDGANVMHRWMPSLALDRAGDLAMGYSTSSSSTFPSIKYAGRLAGDTINSFSQTEQLFFAGTASQLSSTRWGDYSSMTLDPDGCTFWYTTEYATGLDTPPVPPATVSPGFNQRWKTKFGNIGIFPGCTVVGAGGDVSGTVTVNPGGAPITGATVNLGARTTTTDGSGNYSFTGLPAGTYPSMDASYPGFVSASASSIVVTDGNTTTQNFSLTDAVDSACFTDTTQSDFLAGGQLPATLDVTTSPGDLILAKPISLDQQNTAGTSTGTGFGTPAWTGQTFIAGLSGMLVKADIQLFCNGCGATPPNLTLSVRATSAGLPTGADLASVTVPGSTFASGNITSYTANFGSPATLTSGTQYALVLRPVSAPAGSGYFWIRSSPSTYANGSRVLSADSGATWSADSTRDYNFKTYIQNGYSPSGNLLSGTKDANPGPGFTPIWSTLSWNGSTPANTSLKFQVAGSNNANGPFTFVGPDGTAATFFTTSPVNLQPQFYNFRYLEYEAFLASTDNNVTPTLSDVTLCFNDVNCSSTVATITPTPAAVCDSSTGNTASGPAGMTSYAWGITNGTITSATNTQSITYTAGASGTVTLNLTVTAPNGCIVSGSQPVTINPIPPQPTITPNGPTTFVSGGQVTLSSSSASGNQWYRDGNLLPGETNPTYVATVAGNYTVVVTTTGCSSPASAATTVTICPSTATVTNTNDSGAGSLRQAITDLCSGVTINFSNTTAGGATNFFDGSPHTITLASELAISQNLTINGPGANFLTIGGVSPNRVFNIISGTVTISNLKISGGTLTGGNNGGGVLNAGTLTLINNTVSGNTSANQGAGIFNSGTLTVVSSTLSGNTGAVSGGGIYNSGTLNLLNTTISGNTATGNGGGIYNQSGTLTSTNVTISADRSDNDDSGAEQGGGIFRNGGTIVLKNTVAAGNFRGTGTTRDDISGALDSTGSFNLIGDGTNMTGLTNGVGNNQIGSGGSPINAMLGALGANGGPTQTQLLLPGSPAINAGSNALLPADSFDLDGDADTAETLPVDQRGTGFSRIVNTTVDIGAVEVNYTVTATAGTPQSATINTAFATALQATVKESNVVQNNIPVTFTAPVSGPSGTFASSATVNTNASGIATAPAFTANGTAGGPYNVVASLAGGSPSANFALTNTKGSQTITFTTLANKTFGNADFGVSATASSGLTVTFTASGNCTISTNTVHLTGAGACTITAHQAGDGNYNAAPDVPQGFSIAKAASTTAVTSSANPSNLAQNVTFTATVTGPANTGTPTGTVVFKDGANPISCTNAGGQTLNGSGIATCQTASLTAGAHTITADYSGDGNFLISSGTLSPNQTVNNRPLISLSASTYAVNEADGVVHVVINRTGDTSVAFNVAYATDDTGASSNCGTLNSTLASSKCDYTTFLGTAQFAAGQTSVTLDIPINQDSYTEGPESFTINLSNPTGTAALVLPSSATITISDSAPPAGTTNAIDDNTVFVRQQYHDFLNREPDPSGLTFWVNGLNACSDPAQRPAGQTQAQCLEVRRILTSSAFFLSIEFMQSGTFVRNAYVAALDRPATNNMPAFTEWLRDTEAVQRGVIVGQGSWQATLDANRTAFLNDFVTRAEFVGLYPTTDTPTQYVDKLYLHAGVTPGSAQERTDAIAEFGSASTASDTGARGRALARILQNAAFRAREINRAFVQVEYFGYLRRNPNDPPDNNFNGYNFWVTKLNAFNGDFFAAEMVKAFLASDEYRKRFGQ